MKTSASLSGLFGIGFLVLGLSMGVLLVQQEQDFRERADEIKKHKVTICHKTGSDKNEWIQIEVSENAVESHLSNGDIAGNCPSQDGGGDDNNNNNTDANNNGNNDSSGSDDGGDGQGSTKVVHLASSVIVNNDSNNADNVEVIIEKEYVYVTTRFDFWVKFQGIDEKRDDKNVRVIFRNGDEELHVYNNVTVQADNNGVYSGTITDVRPGTYEVLVKSEGYLQIKNGDVTLVNGRNKFYWNDREMIAGDFDNDNDIDGRDIAEFFSFYSTLSYPVTDETDVFDINMNSLIEIDDIEIVLGNYSKLAIKGEE